MPHEQAPNISFLAGIDPGPLALWATLFTGIDPAARAAIVEAALKSGRGRYWRGEIGKWVGRLVPVEILVPDSAARWRPLVRDAFRFLFERLSDRRLAAKVVQQFELAAGYRARAATAPSHQSDAGPAESGTGAGAKPPPGAETAARTV